MSEEELHCLRSVNQRLEHEVQTLTGWHRRLEKELAASREQFEGERVLVKCLKKDMESEIKLARETLTRKYEQNLSELKIRMGMEQSQSLDLQKQHLERQFRADLMKCIHTKDSQMHLFFTHSQQVQREADQRRTADRQRYQSSYEIYLEKLKQDFKRQLTRLLLELKSKERKIASLQRSFLIQITPEESTSPAKDLVTRKVEVSRRSCSRRNKSYYRRSGSLSHHPYPPELRKKRNGKMKEDENFLRDDSHQLYVFHQYGGGYPLETLPEVSEDESKVEESSLSSHHIKASAISLVKEENNAEARSRCERQLSDDEIDFEYESEKVLSLENIIRQLQEELRESKEQNELLEFRLLELGEFESPSSCAATDVSDSVEKSSVEEHLNNSPIRLCGAEVPSEVTNNGDYESSNSHSSVAESRSSCSDCSESLSFQESGIFENQFSEEQSVSSGRSEEVRRELATLASQIEGLVLNFGEGGSGELSPKSEFQSSPRRGIIGHRGRSGLQDFPSDLQYCRQRIQEFEKHLTKFTDVSHMHNLEDKVNNLIRENRRLEEERSELEEAENDSRHQLQRVEEKMKELRGKNTLLQTQLSNEKRFIEQLRIQILQLQEGEEELCSQLTRVDSLAQNYEQRNFELEESEIEIKCTLQVVLHSFPLILLWHLWHYRNKHGSHRLYRLCDRDSKSNIMPGGHPPPLPISSAPKPFARKHKLRNEMTITLIEPKLKKLRCEKEKSPCPLCPSPTRAKSSNTQVDAESQTMEDYLHQTSGEALKSGTRKVECSEEFYREKISQMEFEISRHQELFILERRQLVERHGRELAEKAEDAEQKCQESRKEKMELEERWDSLIKELEQFAASVAKSSNEGSRKRNDDDNGVKASASEMTSAPFPEVKGGKIKGESLVANRIRSLFPDEWLCRGKGAGRPNAIAITLKNIVLETSSSSKSIVSGCHLLNSKNESVRRLEEEFEEIHKREKVLLDEIDRLKFDIREKGKGRGETSKNNNKEMIHLAEENQRLQTMLSEHESAWLNVKELEDENEKLTAELTSSATLQRRLEESLINQKALRLRIEELEQSEEHWRETIGETERKGRKSLETLQLKLSLLNDEAEFLRSKCSQLQDELSCKIEKENKFKLDIQLLNSKLEICSGALDEREQLLESTEQSSRSQISKLRDELNEVHQQLADAECSNGMLSEEVDALERALEEALETTNKTESQVKILKCDLEGREAILEELQNELALLKQGSSCPNPNDLDAFAKNEGGLIGVTRDVNDIMEILQSEEENPNNLTRCESEEQLMESQVSTKLESGQEIALDVSEMEGENSFLKSHIVKLQTDLEIKGEEVQHFSKDIAQLKSQMSDSAQEFLAREKKIKEWQSKESRWWKLRCQEKNDIIHLLARRLAHLSATDMHDYFLDGILNEIRQLRDANYPIQLSSIPPQIDSYPQDYDSLLTFIRAERRRITDLLKESCDDEIGSQEAQHISDTVDFRVSRRIGEEALLVSWTIPQVPKGKLDGYEISVNGNMFLRIRKPDRCKAVLFGVDMSEPLHLSLKCTGAFASQESSITYIA